MSYFHYFLLFFCSLLLSSCLAELELREVSETDEGVVLADMLSPEDMTPLVDIDTFVDMDTFADMDTLVDMTPLADMAPLVDMAPLADMMLPIVDMEPNCEVSYEICDGIDNDCDGQVDEAEWEVGEIVPGLRITFSIDTRLEGANLFLTSKLADGQIMVTIITDEQLANELSYDLPNALSIEIIVNPGNSDADTWVYEIEMISELNGEMRQLPPPYPSVMGSDDRSDESRSYALGNNLSEGIICPDSCPVVNTVCDDGVIYCPEIVAPPIETCDNLDNDCDGNIDENLVSLCSEPERGGGLGVCGDMQSTCTAGEWSSCDYEDLKQSGLIGAELLNDQEQCDCYDNNCNGVVDEPSEYGPNTEETTVDWTRNVCVPDLSLFQSPNTISPHCHIRPRYDQANGGRLPEPYSDFSGTVYLGSLSFHDNSKLWVVNREQDMDGRFTQRPGFSSSSIPTNCIAQRKVNVGGDLTVIADEITIPSGSELSVNSFMGTCDTGSSNPWYHAISGGSGGNLRLIAREINLQGTLSADGAAPNNRSASFSDYSAGSGGAAGSIYLVAPNLSINNAQINARGGRGVCDNNHQVLCDNSSYFGGGPGSTGGIPYGQFEGTGSGGAAYDQTDPERSIRLVGSLSNGSSARIRAQSGSIGMNGEGECDGYLLLSGGSLGLSNMILCSSDKPDTFIEHHLSFIPLDQSGKPITSPMLSLEIFELFDNASVAVSGEVGDRAAMTLLEPLPSGTYRLVVDHPGQPNELSSVLMLSQNLGEAYQSQSLIPDENGEAVFIVP